MARQVVTDSLIAAALGGWHWHNRSDAAQGVVAWALEKQESCEVVELERFEVVGDEGTNRACWEI